jgi:pantothenate kinase
VGGQYEPLFDELAGINLDKFDEIECTIRGLNFLLTTLSDEVYTFDDVDIKAMAASRMKLIQYDMDEDIFPYLVGGQLHLDRICAWDSGGIPCSS